MAFVELSPAKTFTRSALENTVTAFVQKGGTVVFRISGDIYKKMVSPAFIRIMVGTDQHTGRIAILPRAMKTADTKPVSFSAGGRSPIFNVGAARIGVNKSARPTSELPFEISEHGLIVDVRPLMKPVAVSAAA